MQHTDSKEFLMEVKQLVSDGKREFINRTYIKPDGTVIDI